MYVAFAREAQGVCTLGYRKTHDRVILSAGSMAWLEGDPARSARTGLRNGRRDQIGERETAHQRQLQIAPPPAGEGHVARALRSDERGGPKSGMVPSCEQNFVVNLSKWKWCGDAGLSAGPP